MNQVNKIFSFVNHQFDHMASTMDPPRWAALAVTVIVLGFFLLRGNAIRST